MPKRKQARRGVTQQAQQQEQDEAAADAASAGHELLPELLQQVLGRLAQRDRLGGAALVCRAWAEAATAATEHVHLPLVQRGTHGMAVQARMQALWAWLEQHGGQVVSLVEQGEAFDSSSLDLLWDNQHGQISCPERVAWPPVPGLQLDLPRLQALRLLRCPLPFLTSELTSMTALTELHMQSLADYDDDDDNARLSCVLPHLSSLRCLGLATGVHVCWCCGESHDPGLAAAIAGLSGLQALRLDDYELSSGVCKRPLPPGLTQLELRADEDAEQVVVTSSTVTPHLAALTALRDLRLHSVRLKQPGMWGRGLVSLTRFELHGWASLQVEGDDDDDDGDDATARATAELLRLLGQQTALAHLHIANALLVPVGIDGGELLDMVGAEEGDGVERPGGSPLYAHLVHSSMTHLVLDGCMLPWDAGRIMFGRPGLSLRRMARLELAAHSSVWIFARNANCITPADMRRIAACCRGGALRELRVSGVADDVDDRTIDWGVLRRLTRLTQLTVGGDTQLSGLAQLTRLRAVTVEPAFFGEPDMLDVVLHLKQLTHLRIDNMVVVDEDPRVLRCLVDCLGCHKPTSSTGMVHLELRSSDEAGSVRQQVEAGLRQGGVWQQVLCEAEWRAECRTAKALRG